MNSHSLCFMFTMFAGVASLGACTGDDADTSAENSADASVDVDDTTDDTGFASLTGTVVGQTLTPVGAFLIEHPFSGEKVLVIHENPDLFCEIAFNSGLVVVVGFPCGDPIVGGQQVAEPGNIVCTDSEQNWLLVEGFSDKREEYVAVSGAVTIDSIGGAGENIKGSLSGDFGADGSLTGTFEAVLCP